MRSLKKERPGAQKAEARAREIRWVCWDECAGRVALVMEDEREVGDVRDCPRCGGTQEIILTADIEGDEEA